MTQPSENRTRLLCEIAAVLATAIGFVVYQQLTGGRLPYTPLCAALWLAYVLTRARRAPAILAQWGLRLDNLAGASVRSLPLFVLAVVLLLGYRILKGWRPLPLASLPLFVLYPAWGLGQQLLIQALFAANLRRLGLAPALIVPLAAAVFGLMHVPDWTLAALTAAAGAAWATLFLWTPNLIPLALSHGWLGTLVYYWVLARDPWTGMPLAGS